MSVPIEERLVQLLIERGFTPTLHRRTKELPNWTVTFRDANELINVITPVTKVDELWWLCESIGDEAPKTPFESWQRELDGFFQSEYGQNHSDFEDYNWFDEFDNDVSPGDAFEEWKCLTDSGTLGG
jgi:hypothetical protein